MHTTGLLYRLVVCFQQREIAAASHRADRRAGRGNLFPFACRLDRSDRKDVLLSTNEFILQIFRGGFQ
jgi:hypothetical protein